MTVTLAPLPAGTVLAGFEAATLLRCGRRVDGAVEFDRSGAAHHLVRLLGSLDLTARHDSYHAGGYHRYTVHRVVGADLGAPVVAQAWRAGFHRLCATDVCASPRQRHHRDDLAAAAWRAAMLAAAARATSGPLAVRVADADLAQVLVRAGRVLGAPVVLRSRGGRHSVYLTPVPGSALTLLRVS